MNQIMFILILWSYSVVAQAQLKNQLAQNNKNIGDYIEFKIQNNSPNQNHFYVVGPKPDGSRYSYGFPMMPNDMRKENWTIGTKIFKVNAIGFRKLVKTLKRKDEGEIVLLF